MAKPLEGRASGGAGRPRGDTEAVVEGLLGVVRATGLSDSAAAQRMGVSTTTLGRWKVERSELKAALRQAREEFRLQQLEMILQSAHAEQGRGWRAAAWLLERVFPADYARTAAERERAEERETRHRMREEAEEDVQRAVLEYTERQQVREEAQGREEATSTREQKVETAAALHRGAAATREGAPAGSGSRPSNAGGQPAAPEGASHLGNASQNSRNSGSPTLPEPCAPARTRHEEILTGSLFHPTARPLAQAA